ncbi:hypothetical protein DD235_08360 [Corticimicrobacter populi]|uniref:Uncharacterized protein n=2 Tax=Corticimicrobacter populi TaxID=2175229 RepID=A0A2V1K271_9BURK|nr:hypothetical protein DD235_08360 [Corticimicrobacter populi]
MKTGKIVPDIHELVQQEAFYCADCLYTKDTGFLTCRITSEGLLHGKAIGTDDVELTDIFTLFTRTIRGALYVGGECSAHGSCGFIYQKTHDQIDWFLMSLEHGPFIDVGADHAKIRFLSGNGNALLMLDNEALELQDRFFLQARKAQGLP